MRLLVGTGASHFHEIEFEPSSKKLSVHTSISAQQPGWLDLHKGDLYASTESEEGGLYRFIKKDNQWHQDWLAKTSSSGSCHCSIAEQDGSSFILVANYVGHTVDVFDMAGKHLHHVEYDGSGPFEGRQESSHCHQIIQDPNGELVYVNDLGGDKLYRYKLTSRGALEPAGVIQFQPAKGPRHCAFHAAHLDLIYSMCELSNEILVYHWKSGLEAELLQTVSVLPSPDLHGHQHEDYPQPASGGEIDVTRDGKFLYATTRYLPKYKSDTIMFAPISKDGLLGTIQHFDTGKISPWHFSFSPDQKLVAVAFKDSSVVAIYRRDETTGELVEVAAVSSGITSPTCVLFI